jgi:hypothetical protein
MRFPWSNGCRGANASQKKEDAMGMTKTGSGIVLVGYLDTACGVVFCRDCGDHGDGTWMETIYSPDVNEDTPPCSSCDARLDA